MIIADVTAASSTNPRFSPMIANSIMFVSISPDSLTHNTKITSDYNKNPYYHRYAKHNHIRISSHTHLHVVVL